MFAELPLVDSVINAPPPQPEPDPLPPATQEPVDTAMRENGGCSTGAPSGGGIVLAALALFGRRRRRA